MFNHPQCEIDDCGFVVWASGVCVHHYRAGQAGDADAKAVMADLSQMSKTKLTALARSKGITVPGDWEADDLLAALAEPVDDTPADD